MTNAYRGRNVLKKKWLYFIAMFILIVFLFIHVSSDRALRFKVLLYGFPKESLTSEIKYSFADQEKNKYYMLEPTPISHETGPMNAWKVKRVGIFYFASYFGA